MSGAECLVLLCAAVPGLASGVGGCAGAGRTSLAALFHSSEAGAKKGGTASGGHFVEADIGFSEVGCPETFEIWIFHDLFIQ